MKTMSAYELEEEVKDALNNNVDKLFRVFEDEIFKLKTRVNELEELTDLHDSPVLFRHPNGSWYRILEQEGNYTLLAQLEREQFVIAFGLDEGCKAWESAGYWDSLQGAYRRYNAIMDEKGE